MLNILISLKLLFCKIGSKKTFIIEIKNSKVRHASGIEYKKFIHDCEDIVKENNLKNGLIYVVHSSAGTGQLKTSSEIPRGAAQRLRNAWSFYS
jgi:hypothetical protein